MRGGRERRGPGARYAANLEIASAEPQPVPALPDHVSGELHTPGQTTIEAVAGGLGVHAGNLLKAFPVVTASRGLLMLLLRGDHRLNELKLATRSASRSAPATEEDSPARTSWPASSGPAPTCPRSTTRR